MSNDYPDLKMTSRMLWCNRQVLLTVSRDETMQQHEVKLAHEMGKNSAQWDNLFKTAISTYIANHEILNTDEIDQFRDMLKLNALSINADGNYTADYSDGGFLFDGYDIGGITVIGHLTQGIREVLLPN